ncbi:hypothetical protein HGP28_11955 [Vibrio sp. SM6]|uniref:Uncharacterized protein n=1 Tax=Vibrio agarilyticus TaxID=2726741 RepID=A0A7X8TS40_9VIBR|nr:hypothetical protein [Vibrio agarilyticus]NLS13606.1 hypothetical protein [Vibrio agarilyticus]
MQASNPELLQEVFIIMPKLNADVEQCMNENGYTEEEALNELGMNWHELWEDDDEDSDDND